jgi:phage minor structural protein
MATNLLFLDKNEKVIRSIEADGANRAQISLYETLEINQAGVLEADIKLDPVFIADLPNVRYLGIADRFNSHAFRLYRAIIKDIQNDRIHLEGVEHWADDLQAYGFIKERIVKSTNVEDALEGLLYDNSAKTGSLANRWFVDGKPNLVDMNNELHDFTWVQTSRINAYSEVANAYDYEFEFLVNIEGSRITRRYINIVKRTGGINGKRFTYGTNALTIEREQDESQVFTAIVGLGANVENPSNDEEGIARQKAKISLLSKYQGKATASASKTYYTNRINAETKILNKLQANTSDQPDDISRHITIADIEWQVAKGDPVDKPAGQDWIEWKDVTKIYGYDDGSPRYGLIGIDTDDPEILIKSTWAQLQKSGIPQATYKTTVASSGEMKLGETVTIARHDLNLKWQARVVKLHLNRIEDKLSEITIGDVTENSTAKAIKSLQMQVASAADLLSNQKQKTTYVLNNGGTNVGFGLEAPANPKEGDVWYKTLEDGTVEIYWFQNGQWILQWDDKFGDRVRNEVNEAMKDAEAVRDLITQQTQEVLGNIDSELAARVEERANAALDAQIKSARFDDLLSSAIAKSKQDSNDALSILGQGNRNFWRWTQLDLGVNHPEEDVAHITGDNAIEVLAPNSNGLPAKHGGIRFIHRDLIGSYYMYGDDLPAQILKDEIWTISFMAKGKGRLVFDSVNQGRYPIDINSKDYQRYQVTFTAVQDNWGRVIQITPLWVGEAPNFTDDIIIYNVHLERSGESSDWVPAIEDTDADESTVQMMQKFDQLSFMLNNALGDIETVKRDAGFFQQTVENSLTQQKSEITQTKDLLMLQVNDVQAGLNSTISVLRNQINAQVKSLSGGTYTDVTQMADAINSVVSDLDGKVSTRITQTKTEIIQQAKNDATSVATKVSADSFSANLRANGKDVSSLVLNSDGLKLIGDNIVLDGNVKAKSLITTTIKATDISADRIVSGSIDAKKISVKNIAVDSIVGLTSAFILSMWHKEQSVVMINGSGMHTTMGSTKMNLTATQLDLTTAGGASFVVNADDLTFKKGDSIFNADSTHLNYTLGDSKLNVTASALTYKSGATTTTLDANQLKFVNGTNSLVANASGVTMVANTTRAVLGTNTFAIYDNSNSSQKKQFRIEMGNISGFPMMSFYARSNSTNLENTFNMYSTYHSRDVKVNGINMNSPYYADFVEFTKDTTASGGERVTLEWLDKNSATTLAAFKEQVGGWIFKDDAWFDGTIAGASNFTVYSKHSIKTGFKETNPFDSLKYLLNTDVVYWKYKKSFLKEQEPTERIGFVINDDGKSPYKTDEHLIFDEDKRDDSIIVGHLMNAVKALNDKIEKLEKRLENHV